MPSIGVDNKENGGTSEHLVEYNGKITNQPASDQISPQRNGMPRSCPQTPANRIPLADLVGNTEDAYDHPTSDITPDDHVYWQTGPRSSDPSSSVQSHRKSKKRSHSSSPAPSQLEKSSHFPAAELNGSFNLQNLQNFLKTPQMDPALDLWNRYADSGGAKGEEERSLNAFANLISSSPQTPGTTSSKIGLRKAISCGIEWPMSRTKRVKVDDGPSLRKAEEALAQSKQDIMSAHTSTTSKVNLLMEKIQEGLTRVPRTGLRQPSSSSPLPERTTTPQNSDALPTVLEKDEPMALEGQGLGIQQTLVGPQDLMDSAAQNHVTRHDAIEEGSSDYGDDVFDENFASVTLPPPISVNNETAMVETVPEDTNFEAVDFEDLVAAIDADDTDPEVATVPQEVAPQKKVIEDDLEDVFGDDDEDLWDEVSENLPVEHGALQKTNGTSNSQDQVRTNLS